MSSCACCNILVEKHKAITCVVCKLVYNHECLGLSATDARTINTNSKNIVGFGWTCDTCRKAPGNQLQELKALIMTLAGEVADLRTQLGREQSSVRAIDFEEVVQEVQLRQQRSRNVIIHGVPESTLRSGDERMESDRACVTGIIQTVHPDINANNIKPTRLGKYDAGRPTPRPVKVTLDSESLVLKLVKNNKKLKENAMYERISVSTDRTPRQMEYYRTLKQELQRRTSDGEVGLRLRYVHGMPRIVQEN